MVKYSVNVSEGLGNKLFMSASIYGLATAHKVEFVLDKQFIRKSHHDTVNFDYFFQKWLTTSENIRDYKQVSEPHDKFCTFVDFQPQSENTFFSGYFQTEKYFENVKEELMELWKVPATISEELNRKYSSLSKAAFIHVRMGDYGNPVANIQEYYEKCMNMFPADTTFYVCTNNEASCFQMYPFLKQYEVIREDEVTTLWCMSLCHRGGICPVSTFSWWGSWLNSNQDKIVCMPKKWLWSPTPHDIHYKGVVVVE
jgi:hypothetical protein